MNSIKAKLHNKANILLLEELGDSNIRVIVDQFADRKNYFKYLKDESNVLESV
jgi:ribonuclease HIII